METSIYKEYFDYTKEYQSKYGKKTVVLLQVGAFFEIYGVSILQSTTIDSAISPIEDVAEICQLNISEKKFFYKERQVFMSGFRDFTLEKYVAKLTDAGYTVPVFIQEKNGKEVTRKLDHVYSIGTFVACDTDSSPKMTNHIMCIWFELHKPLSPHRFSNQKDTLIYGVSVVNIFTGKSSLFQYETPFYLTATTFDELERYVSIFSPSEIILLSSFEKKVIDKILQFTGIRSPILHIVPPDKVSAKNCTSQKYMKQILTTFFGDDVYEICSEFHSHVLATQSYCYLLHFLQEHNPALVHRIAFPEFTNTSDRLLLANHTLMQLNILDDSSTDSKQSGVFSSVLSLLNKCCTPMGKRLLSFQLTNPTFDVAWLNTEYAVTDHLLKTLPDVSPLRKQLSQIRDIEKWARQFVLRRIYPSSIYHLSQSIQQIREINETMTTFPEINHYLCEPQKREHHVSSYKIDAVCIDVLQFLNDHFVIDACKGISSMSSFDQNIIQQGFHAPLDELLLKYQTNIQLLHTVHKSLNDLISSKENPDAKTPTEYVKIHETEKSGFSLQITAKRSQLLKSIFEKASEKYLTLATNQFLPFYEIKFSKSSSTMMEIDCPLLTDLCKTILYSKDKINHMVAQLYQEILLLFENKIPLLETLANYVARLDTIVTKSYLAKQYHYCRPRIENTHEKSFVYATDLRHALIEHIQENELYVANDIRIGGQDENGAYVDGVLLYGTNAVGKTSFIRSLGITVIMAQSGFFVPCSRFVFQPYRAIFSRILGNDNLFKGLSTFAVEMSELRIILKLADENSLILGDELCSGTEMESALSIFVSGLMKLHDKRASFLFATHFHEITKYDEIRLLTHLALKHMEVTYDREHDCLVYDRKLKSGSGPSTYGLEVCKSLYLDEDFLDCAYTIRNKYYPESRGELAHPSSPYNAKKVRGICEMCGEKVGEEIHHLQPQKGANEDGFIGTFHKNHAANLLSVCESCHLAFHKNSDQKNSDSMEETKMKPLRKAKTTRGIVLKMTP